MEKKMSEKKICKNCGKELEEEYKICHYCKTKTEENILIEDDRENICSSCGKPIDADFEVCPFCGKDTGKNISKKNSYVCLLLFIIFPLICLHRLYVGRMQAIVFSIINSIAFIIMWLLIFSPIKDISILCLLYLGGYMFAIWGIDFYKLIVGKFKDSEGKYLISPIKHLIELLNNQKI